MDVKQLRNLISSRFHIDSRWLTILAAFYFTTVLNLGLWRYIIEHLDIAGVADVFFGASIPVLIFTVLYLIFNFFLWPHITKPLLIFLLVVSSAANYFMFNFGIFIDSNMIRNIVETHTQEALDFVTPSSIFWVLFSGVIPAVLLLLTRIDYQPLLRELRFRIFALAGSLAMIGIIAALFFRVYAAFGRNNIDLPKLINPTNYIYATTRYLFQLNTDRQLQRLDDSARLVSYKDKDAKPTVFILIVGETARAANFSLYGYPRETNPLLAKEDIVSFRNTYSCGTATEISVPCMFSHLPRKRFDVDKAPNFENMLDLLKQTGFDVLWRDNDNGCKGVCERVPTEKLYRKRDSRYRNVDGDGCFDEILVDDLEKYLANIKKNTFIVLHTIGSHGPAYYKRYTDNFRKFTPTCDSAEVQKCTHEELVNTYDNTILYTDFVVTKAINILKKFPQLESGLLYVSDHGESLGENNTFLHSAPYSTAPDTQIKVPMVLWMSENMKKSAHLDYRCVAKKAKQDTFSHDNLYHTLLALMGVKTKTYDKSSDMLDSCRLEPLP